jgi:hypothetical protein
MLLCRGDKVARAVEIGSPDIVLILSPKNRRKVNDRRDAFDGAPQRIRIEQVALHARGSDRNFLARSHERAAADSSIHETVQQARAHENRSQVTKILMIYFLSET